MELRIQGTRRGTMANPRERSAPRLKPIPRLLVVCEGKVTEKIYIDGVRRDRGIAQALVRIEGGGLSPMSVVDLAIKLRDENASQKEDPYGSYDQIWCVFDRDDHKKIGEAKRKAERNGLHIAF